MSRIVVAVFLVCSMIVGITSAWSEDKLPDREKMRERIETLTMWKVMNTLDLDKPTSEKILQIRSEFLKRRKELRASLRNDFHKLRRLLRETKGDQDENQLSNLLKDIRDRRREFSKLWDKQYEQVSKVLSVRKQAELVLLLKDIHREMRSLVLRSLVHRLDEPGARPLRGFDPAAGPRIRRGRAPGGPPPIGPKDQD